MSSETLSAGDATPQHAEPPVREGDVLDGKYEIRATLGRGGMGVVFAARHRELGTLVALKFLARHDDALVARFMREVRAAALLTNEHATRVLDVGRLPSGVPYMVMELLRGESIAARTSRHPETPVHEAVDWILQACEGIAEAHGRGIIHRDIKPANLFLTERADGTTLLKVLDFGVSKIVAQTEEDQNLTTTGSVVGSPSFASPEQLTRPREVDARADVWALGVTLYALLAGARPFVGETVPALYMRILAEAPTRPDARKPDVPRGLADAVMRCLEKEPAARFRDVVALAKALEPFGSPESRGATERVRAALEAAARGPRATSDDAEREATKHAPDDATEIALTNATEIAAPAFAEPIRRRRSIAFAIAAVGLVLVAVSVGIARPSHAPLVAVEAMPPTVRAAAACLASAAVASLASAATSAPPPAVSAAPAPSPPIATPRPPPVKRDPRSYR